MVLAAITNLCSTSSPLFNLPLCLSLLHRASQAGAKLVCLPEASDFIAASSEVYGLSETLEESFFVRGLREGAKKEGVWVSVGVHERPEPAEGKEEGKCFNTQLLIEPRGGEIVAAYCKLHLFDLHSPTHPLLESLTTLRGSSLVPPIPTPLGNVGLLTCYDLRFPEVSLSLVRQGAHVLTYPSAFTVRTGAAHWEVLLRARAVETQCYVLAAAQVGQHTATRCSYGHGMIVDPWGTVVARANDQLPDLNDRSVDDGSFVTADVNLDWLEKIRKEMPVQDHRRGDVYPIL